MGPRRKIGDLKLKSVWDEKLLTEVFPNIKHRLKLWKWLVSHPDVTDFNLVPFEELVLPKDGYMRIRSEFQYFTTTEVEKNVSVRGDTVKLLLELQDGHRVETVVMMHYKHSTVCVSSQIGCQMGCRFCATGTMGIIGDLTSGEILEQLVRANQVTRIRNVVFMGMGEPLQNYDNVKLSLQMMIDSRVFALSSRHITVSTVGVLKNMARFTQDMPQVNLALSLHAPNQQVRLKIVPTASAAHIDKLMEAVDNHIKAYIAVASEGRKRSVDKQKLIINSSSSSSGGVGESKETQNQLNDDSSSSSSSNSIPADLEQTFEPAEIISGVDLTEFSVNHQEVDYQGFRPSKLTGVMIEYILIRDINDRPEHAHELAKLLQSRNQYILLNLIPYNPTAVAEDYHPPTEASVKEFFEICRSKPYLIYTRIRQEMGQDVAAACGQLALVHESKNGHNHDIEESVSRKVNSMRKTKYGSKDGKGENDTFTTTANSSSSSSSKTNTSATCSDSSCECEVTQEELKKQKIWKTFLHLSLPALALILQYTKR